MIEASHSEVNTAYAAVNRIRCDDLRPHIYKTTDAGKTWKEIITGLPAEPINAVHEDPVKKGLLFAGSERSVYVSFDDGGHWQSLRLNMPVTSIRDLVIKDDDMVVGTHGRSFWILDDITPLRQISDQTIAAKTILYKPQTATRIRWSMYPDTPLPQEEPAGQNPPDGAVIDIYLKEKVSSEIMLDIIDEKGKTVRHFSSDDTLYKIPPVNIPLYWIRPQQILSIKAGSQRFLWDMRYEPLDVPPSYPISAIYGNTAPAPTSPWAMPGNYTVRLTVNGQTISQPFSLRMDPRVKTSLSDLQKQYDLSVICYEGRKQTMQILEQISSLRDQVKKLMISSKTPNPQNLKDFYDKLAALEGTGGRRGGGEESFNKLNNSFASLFNILEGNDMPPTTQAANAVTVLQASLKQLLEKWGAIKSTELQKLK
jgi:hypothetical protein